MDLYGCGCNWVEVPGGIGKVKGYKLVSECAAHQASREAEAAASQVAQEERKAQAAIDAKRQETLNTMADEKILADEPEVAADLGIVAKLK